MQVHQLEIDLPDTPVGSSDVASICAGFLEKYEQTYGENSAYPEAGMEMVNFRVVGTVALDRPNLIQSVADEDPTTSRIGSRAVYFSDAGDFVPTEIHTGDRLVPGQTLQGPAIVQRFGDTVVVPPNTRIDVDQYGGLTIIHQEGRA